MKWGIDLGGTKIEGVVLATDGSVLHRHRIPTERVGGYAHIVGRVGQLVDEMRRATGHQPDRIGVGTPGTLDPPTGRLKNSNTTALNGRPLAADLAARLGVPVVLANDANCFAVAETRLGVVARERPGARVVFGVILGTGVGGGLVVDGRVLGGAQGIAGEWGHHFLDHAAGYCYCGRVGCAERLLSGPAISAHYANTTGRSYPVPEIVDRYRRGEPAAVRTLERWFGYFARGIGTVINVVDPDAIVLGGGLGNIDELYDVAVPRVAEQIFNPRLGTAFLRPALGDSAGVFGAALL